MEKKIWSRPLTKVQGFEANEYVAACGVNEKGEYLFTCDAAKGNVYIKNGSSYSRLGGYKPCGATHQTSSMGDFVDGFVDRNDNRKKDSGEEAVIWVEYTRNIFGGKEASNWHATKNVDWKTWTEPAVRS